MDFSLGRRSPRRLFQTAHIAARGRLTWPRPTRLAGSLESTCTTVQSCAMPYTGENALATQRRNDSSPLEAAIGVELRRARFSAVLTSRRNALTEPTSLATLTFCGSRR